MASHSVLATDCYFIVGQYESVRSREDGFDWISRKNEDQL